MFFLLLILFLILILIFISHSFHFILIKFQFLKTLFFLIYINIYIFLHCSWCVSFAIVFLTAYTRLLGMPQPFFLSFLSILNALAIYIAMNMFYYYYYYYYKGNWCCECYFVAVEASNHDSITKTGIQHKHSQS